MLILSFGFFCLFLYFLVSVRSGKPPLLFLVASLFLYLTTTVLYFVCDYFTDDGLTLSVLYHLKVGLKGADFMSYSRLIIFGLSAIILSLLLSILIYRKKANYTDGSNRSHYVSAATLAIVLAFVTNPLVLNMGKIVYYSQRQQQYQFKNYFTTSKPIQRTPKKAKNLVVIYLESLERTYFNQKLFPELINHLRALENKGITFTGIEQLASSYWTIGGMVASQCGIPLVTPSHGNSMSGITVFYPGAVCIGDILKEHSYEVSFIGGADLGFAGKGAFLKTHGFDTVLGSRELKADQMTKNQVCGWGIHDDVLLDLAYDRFKNLTAGKDPFALFILTLDTHHPNGFPSFSCRNIQYGDGSNPILNTVACSDTLVGTFVERLLASPHADDTVIVILSDHIAMKNAATTLLNKTDRKNFFLIIPPEHTKKVVKQPGSSLDIAPTIFDILGFSGDLGLGVDLLSADKPFVSQVDKPDNILMSWRRNFLDLWNFPDLSSDLRVDINTHQVTINTRQFHLPLLLTFDEKLKTNFYFESIFKSLDRYLFDQSADTSFMMIERCDKMQFLGEASGKEGYCIASGKLGTMIKVEPLESTYVFSTNTAKRLARQLSSTEQYRKNIQKIFTYILGKEIVRLFEEVPDNSTVYIINGRYGKYPNIYASMPWISERGIHCVRSKPESGDFYFLSRTFPDDYQHYPGYDLQVVRTGTKLLDFLNQYIEGPMAISAKDEASQHLSPRTRKFFRSLGVNLDNFGYRDSFACVINQGKAIAWKVNKSNPVRLESPSLLALGIDRVVSAGKDAGDLSEILINGKNLSPGERGLNIVVKTSDGTILCKVFDTFAREWIGTALIHAIPAKER